MKKFLMPLLGLCYLVSPYDIVPDFLMGIGWIDDLIVLWLLWRFFQRFLTERNAYRQYGRQARSSYQSPGNGHGENHNDSSRQRAGQRTVHLDPYDVLGISKGATSDEIRTAYRNLVTKYHPDKVLHLGDEFQALAEERFKEIQQAYQEVKPQ